MDRLEVLRTIAAQASQGELIFPSDVNATLRLQHALDDPDCHIELAIKMVTAEPLLCARVMAMANSAAFNRSGKDITDVRAAVARLGFRTLRSLIAGLIMRQLASKISTPALCAKSAQLWRHTAHVAALAQVIARKVTRIDPETAMFAAIVHEAGGFYLLSRAEAFPGLLDDNSESWMQYGEKLIGRGVLKQLGVPDPVLHAAEELWRGKRALPPETLGDTLSLANDLAPVISPLQPPASAQVQQQAAMINFGVGNSTLHRILQESNGEIESLAAALQG